MLEKLKNTIWIIFGGLGVGVLVRRGYDSIRGIPNLADTPIIDIDSLLLGRRRAAFLCGYFKIQFDD